MEGCVQSEWKGWCLQSGVGVRSYQSIFGKLKSPKYLIWEFVWVTTFIDFLGVDYSRSIYSIVYF